MPSTSAVSCRAMLLGWKRGRLPYQETQMADDLTKDGIKNQGEGFLDQAKGRVRNAVGGITGDTSEQVKGKAQELKGKIQRKFGEKQVEADNNED